MAGYTTNIETRTFENNFFREVLYTAPHSQLVVMTLQIGEEIGRRHIARQVKDKELRRKLTPTYRLGCKRILGSNTWYPALTRNHVEVVTDRGPLRLVV